MGLLLGKYLLTAAVVVAASELARHSGRAGALLASLPLVTLLVLVWLKLDGQPVEKLANHAWYTFWYVLPTLPMFALFPAMLARWGFWPAMGAGALLTLTCFVVLGLVIRQWNIQLW